MKLRTFFLLASLIGILAHDGTAQTQTPDCTQGGSALTFTGAGNGPALVANTGAGNGCSTIALTWTVTGFSAAKIHLQGSQDNSSWSDITTTTLILEGANPTSWTSSTVSNRIVVRTFLPFFRMAVDTLTGSGTIVGQIYGYKGSSPAPVGSGGGGGGGSTPVSSFCTSQAEVSLSGTGYTQIVAGSGSTVIRICKLFVTSASGGAPVVNTFNVAFGTCGSSPTEVLTAAAVTGFDLDFGGALQSGAGGAACVKESTANSDKVTITYIQQ